MMSPLSRTPHALHTPRAFPDARRTVEARGEDAFYEDHGGRGARAIFVAVTGLSRLAGAIMRGSRAILAGATALVATRGPRQVDPMRGGR